MIFFFLENRFEAKKKEKKGVFTLFEQLIWMTFPCFSTITHEFMILYAAFKNTAIVFKNKFRQKIDSLSI